MRLLYRYRYGGHEGAVERSSATELRNFILNNRHVRPISIIMLEPICCELFNEEEIITQILKQEQVAC